MGTSRWFSVLKFLLLISLNSVQCGSYCYYSYYLGTKYKYCFYYYYYYYYNSSYSSAGTVVGAIIGGIVGFIFLLSIVVIVCVKVCKKTNHGNVIVRPMEPTVSYINSTQNTYGGYMAYQPAPYPVFPPPYQGPPGSTLTSQSVPSYGDPPPYNEQHTSATTEQLQRTS
ncbi:cysteine and tyrosine-rich protein 1-like isoform X2 [Saccostrea echinata]|uniref:cysteine and tyrosine-rich protein 1-like isoform X2 n=1 Tax=Saccostrea echinata TaxID=191078 RepID=UPI002A837F36|nr:cysteine and tyrosine-rich protein 1-like isoform X2 [Saccostrea echinata]